MDRGRGRGRERGRGRGRGNHKENSDRSRNPAQNVVNPPALQRGNSAQTPAPLRLNAWQNRAATRKILMMDPGPKMLIPRGPPRPNAGGVGRGTDDGLAAEPPAHELQQLELSPATSKTPSEVPTITRVPMKRPDGGGKVCERQMELLVNHFKLEFNPNVNIFHYDIDIRLEKPQNPNAVVRVSKSDAVSVRNKLFWEEPSSFPISKTAYDGEKNIYSAVELPTGKFKLTISEGEEMRPHTYTVSINLVKTLQLGVLDACLKGTGQSVPRDILQAMDIVMRENPSRTQITMGRKFYSKSSDPNGDKNSDRSRGIGDGIIACRGSQQSLKVTSQGLSLCADYTVMPFRKPLPVLDFLRENLNIQFDEWMPLNENLIGKVARALEGLKVTLTHRNTTQKFEVMGLTELKTSSITFHLIEADNASSDRKVTLVNYYVEKYNRYIRYKNLPCLDLSKGRMKNYVPMEFCVLVEGQSYPKDDLSKDAEKKLRNMSLVGPMERKQRICDTVNSANYGPCGGEIARQFGITVSRAMTQVTGRVLSPPALKLGSANNQRTLLRPEQNGQYNLRSHKVVDGKDITRWGILDFSQHWSIEGPYTSLDVKKFTEAFIQRCKRLGIRMENNLFYKRSSMDILSNPKALSDLLKHVYHDVAKGHLQILFCPMAEKHEGYKTLKRICETEIGIMTQCFLSIPSNECQDQYLANLALKMNAKAGGSNMELYEPLPNLGGDGHVMFIGADVNHPTGKDRMSPSITAVAATMNWPGANRYAARLRAQHHAEKIHHIGEMCSELVEAYAQINGVKPKRIIFFRDGVSESQFDMVLNQELTEIMSSIESDGYKPTITLVIAQKRHLTRLFPLSEKDGGKSGNIPPGTVVDTIITHPKEFDFYLNSHYGGLGTSKTTHYHVIRDDHGFSSDQIQRLIYNLCYMFPRCTKPISLAPPVYYADGVASRGRLYLESLTDCRWAASTSSSSTLSISTSPDFDHINFPKVLTDLENRMIFI